MKRYHPKFLYILIPHFIFAALFLGLWKILPFFKLSFRALPSIILWSWLAIGFFLSFLIGFVELARKVNALWKAVITVALSFATLAFFTCYYSILVFISHPEHVIEVQGTTYVAEVRAFLDVYVEGYEYKGPIFRGNKVLLSANLGSGGYDPYKYNPTGEIKYILYDAKHNVIDTVIVRDN